MSGNRLISVFATLMLAGCTTLPRVGQPIQISPYLEQVEGTKVSYSGDKPGDLERIDWEVGDIIRVYQEYNGEVTEAKYRIKSFEPDGYRSKAKVEPVGEPLMYQGEGTYVYRGYYPGNEDGHLAGDVYSFSVSASQSNDVRNNLFMVVSNYTAEAQKVKLEFSPVVDAYEFVLPPDVSKIQLESLNNNLSGDLVIQGGVATLGGNGKTITTDAVAPNEKIRIFTLPQTVSSDDLFLRVYHNKGVKAYGLGNTMYPVFGMYHKYNFPAISSPITPSKVVNNVVFAASTRPPYNKNWYMENGEIKSNGQPVPIEEIWEIIDDLENLNLSNTWEIEEVSAEDLNVFPNLKTVYIDSGNLKDFEVNNTNITELTVRSQSLRTVKINGCHELETFIIGPCQQNLHDIVVDNNRKLKSFELLAIGPGYGTTGVIQVRNTPKIIKFSTT